jgi:hypothetical protein
MFYKHMNKPDPPAPVFPAPVFPALSQEDTARRKETEFLEASKDVSESNKKAEERKKKKFEARQAEIDKTKKKKLKLDVEKKLKLDVEMLNEIQNLFSTYPKLNYFANADYNYEIRHDIQALQELAFRKNSNARQISRLDGSFEKRKQQIDMFMQDINKRNTLKKILYYAADQVYTVIPKSQRMRQRFIQTVTNRVSVAGFMEVVAVMTSILASLARHDDKSLIGENRSMDLFQHASENLIYLYMIGISILTLIGGYLPESFLQPFPLAQIS